MKACCTCQSPPEALIGPRVGEEQEEQHGRGLQRDLGQTHPLRHDLVDHDSDDQQGQEDQVDAGEGDVEGSGRSRRRLARPDLLLAECGDDFGDDHGGGGQRVGRDVRPADVKTLLRSDVVPHSYQNVVCEEN